MLTLETCLKLKDVGWPQNNAEFYYDGANRRKHFYGEFERVASCPTLEELLEAVDRITTKTLSLDKMQDGWVCSIGDTHETDGGYGHTDPCEAAAALWLKLKGVKNE